MRQLYTTHVSEGVLEENNFRGKTYVNELILHRRSRSLRKDPIEYRRVIPGEINGSTLVRARSC